MSECEQFPRASTATKRPILHRLTLRYFIKKIPRLAAVFGDLSRQGIEGGELPFFAKAGVKVRPAVRHRDLEARVGVPDLVILQ